MNQWRALKALPRRVHALLVGLGPAGALLLTRAFSEDSGLQATDTVQGRYYAVDTSDSERPRVDVTRGQYEALSKQGQRSMLVIYGLIATGGGAVTPQMEVSGPDEAAGEVTFSGVGEFLEQVRPGDHVAGTIWRGEIIVLFAALLVAGHPQSRAVPSRKRSTQEPGASSPSTRPPPPPAAPTSPPPTTTANSHNSCGTSTPATSYARRTASSSPPPAAASPSYWGDSPQGMAPET